MPRPQTSIILLDPKRLARELHELRCAARWLAGESHAEYMASLRAKRPLGLNAFAREVGVSAPALSVLLSGERRFLRVRTCNLLFSFVSDLVRYHWHDPAREVVEVLAQEGVPFAEAANYLGMRHPAEEMQLLAAAYANSYSREEWASVVARRLAACARETFVLPDGAKAEEILSLDPEAGTHRFREARVRRWLREQGAVREAAA